MCSGGFQIRTLYYLQNMKRTFILDCISAIEQNESQFLTDRDFVELVESHNLNEDQALQELFETDLFVRLRNGFCLNRIDD